MFKYVKALVIIVLLLLGASLANGQPSASAAGSPAVAVSVDEPMIDEASTQRDLPFTIDNLWILIAATMVFVMHLGFATVESGFMPAKNAVNVIYKNIFILTTGLLTYAIFGFGLMYPGNFDLIDGWLGFRGFGIGFNAAHPEAALTAAYGSMTLWTDFLFQAMFAATAASIVSGAVTGRIKMPAYMIYTAAIVMISYPVTGSWKWGGGWLDELGFYDFAGSALVHGVGGTAALLGAWFLGPRIGKYENAVARELPAHNLPLATIGVLLLWFGWFGFNGGSVLSADPAAVSLVMANTALAAAAGSLAAMAAATFIMQKMDLGMALNGILGGLVGITASADGVLPGEAIIIGALSGALVVTAIKGIEKIGIDDPVGAAAVHGVCGIWGTIAVGIYVDGASVITQIIGILSVYTFTAVFCVIVLLIIKKTTGLRATYDDEMAGLDNVYHGTHAYADLESGAAK